MKSKMIKRAVAIMLCMVIVLSGSGYMLAGSLDTEIQESGQETPVQETPEQEIPAEETIVLELPAEETEEEEIPDEEPVLELDYEDENIRVAVTAEQAGIIPEGAVLSVVPLEKKEVTADLTEEEKAQVEEVNAQYALTEEKLQEKAEDEDYDIVAFLAYDITFVDEAGNKLEPDGEVAVSIEYKEAVIPEEVKALGAETEGGSTPGTDVTVMHLKEDENGAVKEVVDMVADENAVAAVKTTEGSEVQKAEFVTDSFSVFTLTWYNSNELKIQLVNENGTGIGTAGNKNITEASSVSSLAPRISGYTFKKATHGKNGTEIKRLRRNDSRWQYSTADSGDNWRKVDKTVYFVYSASTGLKDLHNAGISPEEYSILASNAAEGDLPISWSRSTGYYNSSNKISTSWNWEDLMTRIGDNTLTITDPNQVWDGSRSSDGVTSIHNYTNYLPNDQITVYNSNGTRKLYDSASWVLNGTDNYYRFRGTFDLGDMELGENERYDDYDYTIQSVLNELDSHIYINDNLYVFVYPCNVTLTNDNYIDYLAFWTGTSNQKSTTSFYGKTGTPAYAPKYAAESGGTTSIEELAKITDGWYANPVEDGAGGIIQNALNTGYTGGTFYIDVIANDYASGGAMYRLQIGAEKTQKTEFGFYKVSSRDIYNGVEGARFTLSDSNGLTYPLTSGEDGYAHAKVRPGVYTLRETAAGGGYEKTDNTWTVVVTKDGFTITADSSNQDDNARLDTYTSGTRIGKYYITNKDLNTYASLELRKAFMNEQGEAAAAPVGLDHITVQVRGTYAEGTEKEVIQTYDVKLTYDSEENVYKGSTEVVSYLDYAVVAGSEHLWKDKEETSEINGGWSFTSEAFTRFENAAAYCTDYQTDCSKLDRPIQDYEFLIIKTTNNKFYLILNHADTVSEAAQKAIKDACERKHNAGLGSASVKVIDFDDIDTEFGGSVTVTTGDAGSNTLSFGASSVWAQYWIGQMDISDYTINGTITNTVHYTKDISITKVWEDTDNAYGTRPEELKVTLTGKAGETIVYGPEEVTVTAEDNWRYTWEGVPVYYYTTTTGEDGSETQSREIIQYFVSEDMSDFKYAYTSEGAKRVGYAQEIADGTAVSRSVLDNKVYLARGNNGSSISGGSSGSTSVGHIDIASNLQATIYVNGAAKQVKFNLTSADKENISITAADSSGAVSFTANKDSITTSSGASGEAQIRIPGTFPVGTKSDPVYYTVTLTKTLEGIPVTMSITTQYWASDNDCPGLDRSKTNWQNGSVISGSGIDLKLEESRVGTLSIQKTVAGVELTESKTYSFNVIDDSGSLYTTVDITLEAGQSSASVLLTNVPAGTYYVQEKTAGTALEGYVLETTGDGSSNDVTIAAGVSGAINVINTYAQNTHDLTITKEWKNENPGEDDLQPDAVSVTVYYTDSSHENIRLTKADGWTWTKENTNLQIAEVVENVNQTVGSGESEMTLASAYKVSVSVTDGAAAVITNTRRKTPVKPVEPGDEINNESYLITNTLEYEDITLEKFWDDSSDTSHRPESLSVDLKLTDGTSEEVVGTYYLTGLGSTWTETISGLPKPSEGSGYYYTMSENWNSDYYDEGAPILDGSRLSITNKLSKMDITVGKIWLDASDQYNTRPDEITANIVKKSDDSVVGTVTLNEENSWTETIVKLPIDEYDIEEIMIPDGYTAEITVDGKFYTITNTLDMNWGLYKISENKKADGTDQPLAGAVFELYTADSHAGQEAGTRVATFTTGADGKAQISFDDGISELADGTYTIKETAAPEGYLLSGETWMITITDGMIAGCTSDAGEVSAGKLGEAVVSEDGSVMVTFTVENKINYTLPSAGGIGTFWYTIGGTLLMMAAALILYKNRYRGVPKR